MAPAGGLAAEQVVWEPAAEGGLPSAQPAGQAARGTQEVGLCVCLLPL